MNAAQIDELMADPCVSYWLKNALSAALRRDPLDAYHDAKALAEILRVRNAIVKQEAFVAELFGEAK